MSALQEDVKKMATLSKTMEEENDMFRAHLEYREMKERLNKEKFKMLFHRVHEKDAIMYGARRIDMHATVASDKRGTLFVKGQLRWKKRRVILKDSYLFIYGLSDTEHPRKFVSLQGGKFQVLDVDKQEHGWFSLGQPPSECASNILLSLRTRAGETLVFAGPDTETMEAWYSALVKAAQQEEELNEMYENLENSAFDDTNLHAIASVNRHESLEDAIRAGGNLLKRNVWGAMPLHLACANGSLECAEIILRVAKEEAELVKKNAGIEALSFEEDVLNARTRDGNTPIALASHGGHAKLVELLLKYEPDLTLRNAYNGTALQAAKKSGHARTYEILHAHVQRLLARAGSISAVKRGGDAATAGRDQAGDVVPV